MVLAHRRVDVRALNDAIRSARQERGELPKGEEAGEQRFQTNDGERAFAPGDRVVFLENNRDLQVKNGMLGTVREVGEGRLIAALDGKGRDGRERIVSVPTESYRAVDHGYATTIHKTQGATVDKAFVLASKSMDRHLAYVAMTRHRQGVELHASREEFRDGMEGLSKSLSRDGAKETTLDYEIRDFAERRGIRVPEAIGRIVAKAFETLRLPKPAFIDRMSPGVMAGKDGGEQGRVLGASTQQDRPGFGSGLSKTAGQEKPLETGAGREAEKDMEKSRDGLAQQQSPVRSKAPSFAGLKLPVRQKPVIGQERLSEPVEQVKHEGRGDRPDQARATVLKALERHADAIADAARMKGLGLPVVAHQRIALEKSGEALEQVKPDAAKLLQSAHRYDRRQSASSKARRARTDLKSSSRQPSARAGRSRTPQSAPGALPRDGQPCRLRKRPPGGQSPGTAG